MRYSFLLRGLKALIYSKRLIWWLGTRFYFVLAKIFGRGWRLGAWLGYKFNYFLEKSGLRQTGNWLLRREVLQAFILAVLFFLAIPQTKLYASRDSYLPGQKTIAYTLIGSDDDYSLEEVLPEDGAALMPAAAPAWREGAVKEEPGAGAEQNLIWRDRELATPVAGGTALFKPILMPGAVVGSSRTRPLEYIVEPGDSLGTIAYQFGLSVATVLWENGLNLRSIIRPGDKLTILPVSGLTHKIKKGDTVKKIAVAYGVKAEEIIKFNKLKEDGSDLTVGERIMVPGGVRPQDRAIARVTPSSAYRRAAVPPAATYRASAAGWIWPTAARTITQYFSWRHQGLDVAGPYLTANYAAKAGTVETAQCGWNSGFGCTIVINHGGGVKSRYSHNARLLVSAGEYVQTGQTIALMGNTGKVRGRTGIHIDFRIYVSGVQVNPLRYVR